MAEHALARTEEAALGSEQIRTRVYVVDDDDAVRRGIERLLRVSGQPCRGFKSATAYLAAELEPCDAACLVLDIRMPEMTGTQLQARLADATEAHAVPIVFVTGHGDIPTCVQTLKAGAVSFLTKPFDAQQLLQAVHEALQIALDQRRQRRQATEACRRYSLLSPREREVFQGVIRGLLNKQIAAELAIAEKTVKVHRGRVMEKMGVVSVAELVRLALLVKESSDKKKTDAHG